MRVGDVRFVPEGNGQLWGNLGRKERSLAQWAPHTLEHKVLSTTPHLHDENMHLEATHSLPGGDQSFCIIRRLLLSLCLSHQGEALVKGTVSKHRP